MGNAFLGTDERKHLRLRIEMDTESFFVPSSNCRSEFYHSFIGWIAVVLWIFCGCLESFDNELWGGEVWVSNSQVNEVDSFPSHLLFLLVNLCKEVRWDLVN